MKKLLVAFSLFASSAMASETITVVSPYSPSASMSPAYLKIIDEANKDQKKYKFVLEFKPGAEQLLAVNQVNEKPAERIGIVAAKFVEHVSSGKAKKEDYVAIHALGDACWAVISNRGNEAGGLDSLKGQKDLLVGGVGFGNAAHLTSLQLAEKYGFKVRYVPFKSNFDALVLMAGDGSVNMVIDRFSAAQQFKEKKAGINILAASCPTRHPDFPNVKTLAEQGVTAPYIFNVTVAHKDMPADKRKELGEILNRATLAVGESEILKISDMRPPVFRKISADKFFDSSYSTVDNMLKKHAETVKAASNQ